MERDSAISHGASSFLKERLMLTSDAYRAVFCKYCGAYARMTTQSYECRLCKRTKFGKCTHPYTFKLLIQLLAAIGLNLHPDFLTYEEYADRIFNTRTNVEEINIDDIQTQLEVDEEVMKDEIKELEEETETDFSEVYD